MTGRCGVWEGYSPFVGWYVLCYVLGALLPRRWSSQLFKAFDRKVRGSRHPADLHEYVVKRDHCTAFWAVQDPSMTPTSFLVGWGRSRPQGVVAINEKCRYITNWNFT